MREEADDGDQEVDALHQMHFAEGEAHGAGRTVDADHGDAETQHGGDGGFGLIAAGDAAQASRRPA